MSKYFGVVGNRDYIKLNGKRRPFWDFLDRQPDGWLCSLAYKRGDVPNTRPRIWDCGAWSYRKCEIPRLGKNAVTAHWAVSEYARIARQGDYVVAPDHMLIPGVDLDARREFNQVAAFEFIEMAYCLPRGVVPMAVIHGVDRHERIRQALDLRACGYGALAIGGVAGRAGTHRAQIIDIVSAVRDAVPDVWLHVLGVSSPSFAEEWRKIGCDSFDGASHFKQAFTAGKFYVYVDRNTVDSCLVAFKAARPGEATSAPSCYCKACTKLRGHGIDTRRYGSNESNMGRAAHNLNQLMRALDEVERA
jgi:hypothetical protein